MTGVSDGRYHVGCRGCGHSDSSCVRGEGGIVGVAVVGVMVDDGVGWSFLTRATWKTQTS